MALTECSPPDEYRPDEGYALRCDETDPLRDVRDEFHIPRSADGTPVAYLAGNSLGLQPKGARAVVEQELTDWADLAVDAHFQARTPWYTYHEVFREPGARLVGAEPGEVVMMNGLTVNLHLMLVTFYAPTASRYKVLMEYPAFPSDTYAVKTHLRFRGIDPADGLVLARPRQHEHTIRTEDIEQLLEQHRREIAVVLLGGINFVTGQLLDIPRITRAAHRQGCIVGWDLAHAAGNVPLRLHGWGVDFAVWCSYKYLNAGPGAAAGSFIHEKHAKNSDLPRFGGWWGNDPKTRFLMHLRPEFVPRADADGWQISNPPIMAMAPLKASLDVFDRIGMAALREKSLRLTGYLEFLLGGLAERGAEVITPRRPEARGCQLSIRLPARTKEIVDRLHAAGILCDFREPDIIRVAPVPLYNTFHDVWRFAKELARHCGE